MEKKRKQEDYRWLIGIVAVLSVLGIVVSLYATLCMGEITPQKCFVAFLNIALYISLLKYTIQYFWQGKEATITGMLVRYAASLVGTLLAMRDGNTAVFMMTAVTMVLVPFVAGDLSKVKRDKILMAVVLILSSVVAALMLSALEKQGTPGGFASFVLYFSAMNQWIQWLLFMTLYLRRCKKVEREMEAQEQAP